MTSVFLSGDEEIRHAPKVTMEEKTATHKPRREASKGVHASDTWISDFQPEVEPEREKIIFCCVSNPICGALLW